MRFKDLKKSIFPDFKDILVLIFMSLNSFPDIGAIFDRFDTSAAEEFIANYFSRVFL